MVSIMKRLATQVGQWHVVVDLANAFFSIAIAPQSQDQFAFTWKDWQYTFTVLPQGYKHSPTICHQLVSQDLEQVTRPEGVVLEHYIDDVLLSGPHEVALSETKNNVLQVLAARGWAVNPSKIQRPSQEVILGILWSGPQRKIPQKAIETITHFPEPTSVSHAQTFLGLLGYWRTFIPHLGYILQPIQAVVQKKAMFICGGKQHAAFKQAKEALSQHAVLSPGRRGTPSNSR
ncbi:unnamed protein product [Lepidochelys kempii]